MKYIFLFIFFQFFSYQSIAQTESPYHISWKKDGWILGAGLASYGTGLYNIARQKPPTAEDIYGLNEDNVWSFEQGIIGNDSRTAEKWSDVLLATSYAYPFIIIASKKRKGSFLPNILVLTEGYFWTRSIAFWTKSTVRRYRPYAFDSDVPIEERTVRASRTSFISGHASSTAFLCFTSAKMFADHFPDAKAKPIIWAGATTITGITAYLRTAAGRHFPTDVIIGSALGAAVGILIPEWHKKKPSEKLSWRVSPTDYGVRVGLIF